MLQDHTTNLAYPFRPSFDGDGLTEFAQADKQIVYPRCRLRREGEVEGHHGYFNVIAESDMSVSGILVRCSFSLSGSKVVQAAVARLHVLSRLRFWGKNAPPRDEGYVTQPRTSHLQLTTKLL